MSDVLFAVSVAIVFGFLGMLLGSDIMVDKIVDDCQTIKITRLGEGKIFDCKPHDTP